MKIYVLSLKDSERRISFYQENEFLSTNSVFFDAIEGRYLQDSYIDNINKATRRYKRNIGKNEIACADSHIAIYNDIIRNGIEWAIILEDDIVSDIKILNINEQNLNKLNPENLYILGGQEGLASKDMIIFSKKEKIEISKNIELIKTIASSKYIYRTCGYLIHMHLAKKIIKQRKKSFFLADDWNYLSKNKVINNIYLGNLITHPIDLASSILQNERNSDNNQSLISKIKNSKLREYKIKLRKIIYG